MVSILHKAISINYIDKIFYPKRIIHIILNDFSCKDQSIILNTYRVNNSIIKLQIYK